MTKEETDKIMKVSLEMVGSAEESGLSFDESVIAAGVAIGVFADEERHTGRRVPMFSLVGRLVTGLVESLRDAQLDDLLEELQDKESEEDAV